ncbi:MAG: LPS assembly protein LptD [Aestuariivita sp.]|nr:LPS assembly protein LptD [Aestuariivita sp.]MCY4203871.1 LPS assembly protein LptD [Aestuariivita sp.]
MTQIWKSGVFAASLFLFFPFFASAQESATAKGVGLIADRITLSQTGQLVASGNVEAVYGAKKLHASRVTYNRGTGQLGLEGPLRIIEDDTITILADEGEITEDFREGLMLGAKMIISEHTEISSPRVERYEGRFSRFYDAMATSCQVCEGEAPFWQIRATRVTHDQQEKQLYFENAQLRILDLPVLFLPTLRLPDPTLERATGFLIPSLQTTSQLSAGVKVPYFVRLDDHSDLTLTPYLSAKTTTLNFNYRHAFSRGRLEFEGAFTRDDLMAGLNRGYFFGAGGFALQDGHQLLFDLEWASDSAYLYDYQLPERDRPESQIVLTRTRHHNYYRASLTHFQSLREGDVERELPTLVADLTYQQRYFPKLIGGEVRLGILNHGHRRRSKADALGRDVAQTSVDMNWSQDRSLPAGIRAKLILGLSADVFRIWDDQQFTEVISRTTPTVGLSFGLPMIRVSESSSDYIEPIAQFGWSQVSDEIVPEANTSRVEFDQGNLLALSRFPSYVAREDGAAFAYGFSWERYRNFGHFGLTVGQVIRETTHSGFSQSSGLSGKNSDILIAAQLVADFGLDLSARTILDQSLKANKFELRAEWRRRDTAVRATYVSLAKDLVENRQNQEAELNLSLVKNVRRHWTTNVNWRYDVEESRMAEAGVGLTYRNECVELQMALNRRNASSASIEPTTDFAVNVVLHGFSSKTDPSRYRKSCRA